MSFDGQLLRSCYVLRAVAQVRPALRHLTLEAQAEATGRGQEAARLRQSSKVRGATTEAGALVPPLHPSPCRF